MLGRGNLFKRPGGDSSDDEDVYNGGREVVNKAVDVSIARKLDGFYKPRNFVVGSSKSQAEMRCDNAPDVAKPSSNTRALTADERNKLSAKLMKAEMMGDKKTMAKLQATLDANIVEGVAEPSSSQGGDILLTHTDVRTGVTMPVDARRKRTNKDSSASTSLRAMVEEERTTTADDSLAMLGTLASKAISGVRQDDDNTLDDIYEGRKEKKKRKREREEKDERKVRAKAISDQKRYEHTLSSCRWCIDGGAACKQLIVASGIQTYLCIPPVTPLTDGHLYIVPQTHAYSNVQLDEDVYAEMQLWRRGLVAYYAARDEDCVFVETALGVRQQKHMIVESIPIPRDVGDTAPIYFKKAIDEYGSEWATNKKLLDLSKKDIRHSVPKGFPYFAIDFGHQSGYAHIIEDDKKFPANFAHSIIGGMLDLDHSAWRRPKTLDPDDVADLVKRMKAEWKPFDWTERAKAALKEE